ncbi:MAG: O-antigen ligase family protein [Planctomycetota bacterium]|nr:O-antigen ligase family protein [Planctomycetota bacterium]
MSSSIASDSTVLHSSPVSLEPKSSLGHVAQAVSLGLLSVLLVLSLWWPCDTATSVAKGESFWHIGLSLAAFFFATIVAGSVVTTGASQRMSVLWLLIAMVVAWHALVTGYSIGRVNSRNAIYGFWQSTALWCLIPTVAWLARSPQGAARLLKLWWVIALFVILWGFWEYAVLQPAQQFQLTKDRIGYLQRNNIDPDSAAAVLIVNRIESTEVLSVFALANSYAGFLVALWPLWLGWMLQGFRRSPEALTQVSSQVSSANKFSDSKLSDQPVRLIPWLIPLVLVIATALALLLTKSRTAWLATGLSTVLAMLLDPVLRSDLSRWIKQKPGILGGIAGLLLVVFGAVYAIDPLIFQEAGKSLAYRMDYWRGACALITEQPWLGFGSLNFQTTYLQVKSITASESPADPHNFLLELAHSGGLALLGLTVLLLTCLAFFRLRQRIFTAETLSEPIASEASDASKYGSLFFWGGAMIAAILVFLYAFFTAGDLELYGTAIVLAGASAFGYWLTRNPAAVASVHLLVKNQPILLLVSFLGVMVHFLASGGWMFPGTMISPAIAMGLWIAGANWIESPQSVTQLGRLGRSKSVLAAAALLGLWGWSMAMPWYQTQRVYASFPKDNKTGRLLLDNAIADQSLPSVDEYFARVTSAPLDPDLARWGMEFSGAVMDSDIPVSEKASWLHQFQQACKFLIERSPKDSTAYADAAVESLRTSIGQTLDTSLAEEMAFRRQGGGPALRGPSASGAGRSRGGADRPTATRTIGTQLQEDSLRYYQEATKYAPANAELHLQTAIVAAMLGNWKVCEARLDQAEEIDRETKHRDRKIEAARVWIPHELAPLIEDRAKSAKKIPEESSPQWDAVKKLLDRNDSVPGEPVRQMLRSFFKNP